MTEQLNSTHTHTHTHTEAYVYTHSEITLLTILITPQESRRLPAISAFSESHPLGRALRLWDLHRKTYSHGNKSSFHAFHYVHACMQSHFSHVQLFATLRTIARQAPLSMGFSRQAQWSALLCPSPGCLPNPGIEPSSFISPALAGRFFTTSATWDADAFQ